MSRILFILHLPPPVHGPSMVGKVIQDSGVINTNFCARYINLSTSRTVNEIGKKPLLKVLRFLSIYFQLLWQFISFRPKVCYFTINSSGLGFYKEFPLVMLALLFGKKRVYHFHNKGVSKYQHKTIDNLLYRMVFHKAKVILLSEHLYYDVEKYVPRERVYFCANGIEEHAASSKGSFVPQDDNNVEILFLSNLIASKGVFVLLKACNLLNIKGLSFHCTFVGGEGDISETQLTQTISQMQLNEVVNYAGKKYGIEKDFFFNNAHVFVHPTLNDCQPLVILEAMQHSLPVVSTHEGAIPGMVNEGSTGFLVSQTNANALAEKLELLIQNPTLRQQMGAAGRKKYEQEFTLNAFEERLKGILNNAASS